MFDLRHLDVEPLDLDLPVHTPENLDLTIFWAISSDQPSEIEWCITVERMWSSATRRNTATLHGGEHRSLDAVICWQCNFS